MIKDEKRIFGLDFIRALAILMVLCSHSVVLLAPESNSSILFAIKFFGTIGVDIFFVLSGFLIGGILLKMITLKQTRFKDVLYFWVRRWFRTLPNYYLILGINILLGYVLFKNTPLDLLSYFFFLQNFNAAQSNFFTESWSLSIEEFAYILLPLLLLIFNLIFRKTSVKLFLALSLFSILLITLNRLYFDVYVAVPTKDWSASLRKVVIYRLDSIYYGFIAAYIFKCYRIFWDKQKLKAAVLGTSLFVGLHAYIVVTGIKPQVESSFFNLCYLPLVSISIALLFPYIYNLKSGQFLNSIITKISLWSYSLYLVNYSIVVLSIQYFFNVETFSVLESITCLMSYWIISFLLAILLFHFYEIPTMKLRDSKTIKKIFYIDN